MENLPAVPFTCTTATDPEFSFVGKSSEKVTGFLPEQFTGKNSFWIKRIHPEDKVLIKNAFAGIAKKITDEQGFRWKCADGQYRQFINYLRYIPGESGKSSYVAGIWQQILKTRPPEG